MPDAPNRSSVPPRLSGPNVVKLESKETRFFGAGAPFSESSSMMASLKLSLYVVPNLRPVRGTMVREVTIVPADWISSTGRPSGVTPERRIPTASSSSPPVWTKLTLPGRFFTGSVKVTRGKMAAGTPVALALGTVINVMTEGASSSSTSLLLPPGAITRKVILSVTAPPNTPSAVASTV